MQQDLFSSGAIKSATDFQVYKEVAGLSGLDFAYTDNTAVYHTKVLFCSIYIWICAFFIFPRTHSWSSLGKLAWVYET